MTVLVTGATGTIGSEVVRGLRGRGVPVRALVRDAERARNRFGAEVELAQGDFATPEDLDRAVRGVDQVFLSSPNHPDQARWEITAVNAAVAAGVDRIVKLSACGAEVGSALAFWDAHGRIEAHLDAAPVTSVVLRPTFFMSGILAAADSVRGAGAMFLPAAGAKVAMVDPSDVADVAVAVLADGSRHDGRCYELTGPEAVTFDDVAGALSDVIGRTIGFVAVPDEGARQQLVENGLPEWFAANLVTLFGKLRDGAAAHVTDDVHAVAGRPPGSVIDYLRRHTAVFAGETKIQ